MALQSYLEQILQGEMLMPLDTLEQNLRLHVTQLAQEIGERNLLHPAALHAAEDYITRCWQEQGYAIEKQAYRERDIPCANLEISHTGTSKQDKIILIGAHYDSVTGSPGANDNASGVAVMLELSRLFHLQPTGMTLRMSQTVRAIRHCFVFFIQTRQTLSAW